MAIKRGYYDTFRECSLTELTDELGIARFTSSEPVHRAEGTLSKPFVSWLVDVTVEMERP